MLELQGNKHVRNPLFTSNVKAEFNGQSYGLLLQKIAFKGSGSYTMHEVIFPFHFNRIAYLLEKCEVKKVYQLSLCCGMRLSQLTFESSSHSQRNTLLLSFTDRSVLEAVTHRHETLSSSRESCGRI